MNDLFHKIALKISRRVGSPSTFLLALSIIIIWAFTGPIFGFSDTWQLIINTGTTIVTFLMVFIIQNTQNRDGRAMQIKLDELLKGVEGARTELVDLEELSDDEIDQLEADFRNLHNQKYNGIHKLHTKISKEKDRRSKA
jgi:low affinity Fe/Cu permease